MKKGLFYAILASILWAIVNPFIKQGLSYDFTPMNFAGIRFTRGNYSFRIYLAQRYVERDTSVRWQGWLLSSAP